MAKIVLSDLVNLNNPVSAVNTINANSAAIEAAFENTLSRDGTQPNTMLADLDMNSHRILNIVAATTGGEPVNLDQVNAVVANAIDFSMRGTNGWTPVLSVTIDGERRVLRVTDWVGGTGTKPETGLYVSESGLTNNIVIAVDIRGEAGGGIDDAVPIAGGTMTGPLILSGDPVVDLGAATAQYVDERIYTIRSKTYSVLDYGADPTGVTMSTAAFAACATACVADNADFFIPEGYYSTDATTTINLSGLAFNDQRRINVIGAGKGRTEWRYWGPPGTSALNLLGPNWATSPASRQTVKGFRLRGMSPTPATGRIGIGVTRAIGLHWEDLEILECYYGAYVVDIVHWSLTDVNFAFNNYGLGTARSPSYGIDNNGSPTNILVLNKCSFIANRQWGATFQDSANIVFVGGSFEGNGWTGAWTSDAVRWGVRILDGGYNGAANLMLYGTHFESSGGTADIIVDHSAHPGVYVVDGCDFVRNGTANFPTNNILFGTTGATKSQLIVRSGFRSVGGYVPNAGRPYVAHTGTLTNHTFSDEGCMYESATETPTYTGKTHGRANHAHAWAVAAPAGTLFASSNITSITNPGTGTYVVTFAAPTSSAIYAVVPTMPLTAQFYTLSSRTVNGFTMQVLSSAGAAAAPTTEFGFTVFAR